MFFRTTSTTLTDNRGLAYVVVVLIAAILSACSSVPTIRDSKRLSNQTQKMDSIHFLYQQGEMRVVETSSTGPNSTLSFWDNGFHEFGDFLTKQAANVFSSYGIKVVESRKIGSKDALKLPDSAPILMVFASSGKLSATSAATVASYVFEARLMDVSAKRVIWRATIDTKTWSGRDFVMKNVEKTLYDATYADQLLKTLAERMKQDGIL